MRKKNNTPGRSNVIPISTKFKSARARARRDRRGSATHSPVAAPKVANLIAECYLPCQHLTTDATVYDEHGGRWIVEAVRRRDRHIMLTLAGVGDGLALSACGRFSPTPTEPRVAIAREHTFILPVNNEDDPHLSRFFTFRDDEATDYARGDLISYHLVGEEGTYRYGWLVAFGWKIAINEDLYDPDGFDVEEHTHDEIVMTGRALRQGEGIAPPTREELIEELKGMMVSIAAHTNVATADRALRLALKGRDPERILLRAVRRKARRRAARKGVAP